MTFSKESNKLKFSVTRCAKKKQSSPMRFSTIHFSFLTNIMNHYIISMGHHLYFWSCLSKWDQCLGSNWIGIELMGSRLTRIGLDQGKIFLKIRSVEDFQVFKMIRSREDSIYKISKITKNKDSLSILRHWKINKKFWGLKDQMRDWYMFFFQSIFWSSVRI